MKPRRAVTRGRHRRRRLRGPVEPRHERGRERARCWSAASASWRSSPQFGGERIVLKDGLGAGARARGRARRGAQRLHAGLGRSAVLRHRRPGGQASSAPSTSRSSRSRARCSWAFARVGLKWDDAAFMSLHGRPLDGPRSRGCGGSPRLAVLTDDENSPARIAAHLLEHGETALDARGCARTSAARTSACALRRSPSSRAARDIAPLNVLLLVRDDPSWRPPPAIPFLHEDAFAKRMPKKGLITKREVRLLSLAALADPAGQRGLGHRRRLGLGRHRGGAARARGARLRDRGRPRGRRDLPRERAHARRRQRARRRGPRARGAGRSRGARRGLRRRQQGQHGGDHRRRAASGCARAGGWSPTRSRSRTRPRPTRRSGGAGSCPR